MCGIRPGRRHRVGGREVPAGPWKRKPHAGITFINGLAEVLGMNVAEDLHIFADQHNMQLPAVVVNQVASGPSTLG
jgi:hypothetical protein